MYQSDISSFFAKRISQALAVLNIYIIFATSMVNFLYGILFVILTNLLSIANITHTANITTVCDNILTTFSEKNTTENNFETEVTDSGIAVLHDYAKHQCNMNNNRRRCSRSNTSKQFKDNAFDIQKNSVKGSVTKNPNKLSSFCINYHNNKNFLKLNKLII